MFQTEYSIATAKEAEQIFKQAGFPGKVTGLSLDSLFHFECQNCGDCCWNRLKRNCTYMDVHDFKNIKKFFPEEAAALKRIESGDLYGFYEIPMTESPLSEYPVCTFLTQSVEGKPICKIHQANPIICALAPISFVLDHNHGRIALGITPDRRKVCTGLGKGPQRKLKDWLQEINFEERIQKFIRQIS